MIAKKFVYGFKTSEMRADIINCGKILFFSFFAENKSVTIYMPACDKLPHQKAFLYNFFKNSESFSQKKLIMQTFLLPVTLNKIF